MFAVRTRRPFGSDVTVEDAHPRHGIDGVMPGEKTAAAVAAQPEWLAQVPTERRLPPGRIVFTGCGTSFHAAQTGGAAMQALEAALDPPDADVLVCVSHEGTTAQTIEAARAFPGETWLVTGAPRERRSPSSATRSSSRPRRSSESYCHTVSYTCAVAALAALRGEDVSWLPAAVEAALQAAVGAPPQGRVSSPAPAPAWPTAQEAVLKLREGAYLPAEAHHTEQLLHGHLAAIDETVRAYVLDGPRAADAVRGARGARLRDDARAGTASGRRRRLLPAADLPPPPQRASTRTDPLGGPALEGGAGRVRARSVTNCDAESSLVEQPVDLGRGVVVDDADAHRAVARPSRSITSTA